MTIPVAETVAALRTALAPHRAGKIALVPTMGALHEGHLALAREARERASFVAASIFVNPTQFAPHEDFAAYPRDLTADLAKMEGHADLVFAPSAHEMYPDGFVTGITVDGPSAGLESDFRPHFFGGVVTVVAKLLIAALPDYAMFGEKDYQQMLVVKRLTRDLGLPTEIVGVPVVREADGLALSSRNAYLDPAQRQIAARLNLIMHQTIAAAPGGLRAAEAAGRDALIKAGFDRIDYISFRDAENLALLETLNRPARLLAAAHLGRTRLIDNMAV